MRRLIWLSFVLFLGLATVFHATPGFCLDESLDLAAQSALNSTLDLLKSQSKRSDAVKENPAAKSADSQIQELSGSPERTQKVYELSAEIFSELVQKAGGDPTKLQALLEKAKSDPKGFAESLSPSTQAKLKALAEEIQKASPRH